MKIAVIDDERPSRSELIYLIRQCLPDAEILEADCAEKLMELLKTERFDAFFVDIDLGGENGTTLASMIRSCQPAAKIVFATAYGEYAVRAFELNATDYLLKPFDLERVRKTVERLGKTRAAEEAEPDGSGIGRVGSLKVPCSILELARRVKQVCCQVPVVHALLFLSSHQLSGVSSRSVRSLLIISR